MLRDRSAVWRGIFAVVWVCVGIAACDDPPARPAVPTPLPSQVAPETPATAGWLDFDPTKLRSAGGMDPAVFTRVMQKRRSSFKVCYRKALADNPQAQGDLTLRFTVSPTGRVAQVERVGLGIEHAAMESCVLRVVRRIQFPPLDGKTRVTFEYPLQFYP